MRGIPPAMLYWSGMHVMLALELSSKLSSYDRFRWLKLGCGATVAWLHRTSGHTPPPCKRSIASAAATGVWHKRCCCEYTSARRVSAPPRSTRGTRRARLAQWARHRAPAEPLHTANLRQPVLA